jgi:serine/threonine-protein kinase
MSTTEVLGDKYELVRMLGEGGMGSVWEARNRVTGKRVAVKRMSQQLVGNGEATARFLREARAATRIEHPNVVQIFDVGVHEGAPFMVMEFLEGEPLTSLRSRLGVIEPRGLVELVMPVLLALDVTHAQGIVHRDLKPDNIYLTKRGQRLVPKLLDFGISKVLGEADLKLTRTGTVMGTPYYMAPEQAAGKKELDHRADVYAMGVILYECLTGRLPFEADNYNALLVAILTSDPPPVGSVRSDVPAALSAAIERAMTRDVSQRFATVADLAEALGEAVGAPGLWEAHADSAPQPQSASGRAHILSETLPAGGAAPPSIPSSAAPATRTPAPTPAPVSAATGPTPSTPSPPLRTTFSSSAREVSVVPQAPPSHGIYAAGGALALLVASGVGWVVLGGGGAAPSHVDTPPPSSTTHSTTGDGSRTARALACAAEGQDRCVVDLLLGHDETETDSALLIDALRRLGDRDAAAPLARSYVERWPSGPHASDYAGWLGEIAHEGLPHGEPPPEEPPPTTTATDATHTTHRSRTVSTHTIAADVEDRAAVGAPPPPPPPSSDTASTGTPTHDTHRSGGLDLTEF